MATTPIQVALAGISAPQGNQKCGPYFSGVSGMRFLVVVRNPFGGGSWDGVGGGVPPTSLCYCTVYQSTDSGATWAEADAANAKQLPPQNSGFAPPNAALTPARTAGFATFNVVQSGTDLYIALPSWDFVTYKTSAPHPLYIAKFDMLTATWQSNFTGPSTGGAPQLPAVSDMPLTLDANNLFCKQSPVVSFYMTKRTSDGAFVVLFQQKETVGASWVVEFTRVWYVICSSAGVWGSPVQVFGSAGEQIDYRPAGVVEGAGGIVHLFAEKWTAAGQFGAVSVSILHASLTSGNSLSASQTVAAVSSNTGLSLNQIAQQPVSRIHGSTTEIIIGWVNRSTLGSDTGFFAARADSAVTPVWTTQTIAASGSTQILQVNPNMAYPMVSGTSDLTALTYDDNGIVYNYTGAVLWSAGSSLFTSPDAAGGYLSAVESVSDNLIAGMFSNSSSTLTLLQDFYVFTVGFTDVFYFQFPAVAPPIVAGVNVPLGSGGTPYGLAPIYKTGNRWDCCLQKLENDYRRTNFQIRHCPTPTECVEHDLDAEMDGGLLPWNRKTAQAQQLRQMGSLLTPSVAGDNLVCTYQVPIGYSATIDHILAVYTGTGFTAGSGDIFWRLKINRRWEKDLGNVQYQLGSVKSPYPAKILLTSGQSVTWYVSVVNTSGMIQVGASYILAAFFGWEYPDTDSVIA